MVEKINLKTIQDIEHRFNQDIANIQSIEDLEKIKSKYLGSKGELRKNFLLIKYLPPEERKKIGEKLNQVRLVFQKYINNKENQIKKEVIEKDKGIDVTIPGKKIKIGHIHPIFRTIFKIEEIFGKMGFEVAEGQELENEWYNFDSLNMPADHPARDIQDTFWIKQKRNRDHKKNYLMRTQTSAMQVRYMEKHSPPFRVIVPGRTFRYEATDASHEMQFYQCEGFMVDSNISVANFNAIMNLFFKHFFADSSIETRMRPGYFPFTEPSFEFDIKLKGEKKWLETVGAGMIHPNVFKSAGLNPQKIQGFAFGMGVDRLTMIKYKIDDIRLFYQNDIRFLEQF